MTDPRDDEAVEALRNALANEGWGVGAFADAATRSDVESLLSALRALGFTIERDWQRAEDAPEQWKDGRQLLGCGRMVGDVNSEGEDGTAVISWEEGFDWHVPASDFYTVRMEPSFIRPLPKPPKE